jgi:hypothetical protein
MDTTIIKRLKIPGITKILNITGYSEGDDDLYNIKLVDITNNNKVLHSSALGEVVKRGRMLNLLEAHGLICDTDHRITHCHDPVADVILTKCIFNKIVERMGYGKLYNMCKKNTRKSRYN